MFYKCVPVKAQPKPPTRSKQLTDKQEPKPGVKTKFLPENEPAVVRKGFL